RQLDARLAVGPFGQAAAVDADAGGVAAPDVRGALGGQRGGDRLGGLLVRRLDHAAVGQGDLHAVGGDVRARVVLPARRARRGGRARGVGGRGGLLQRRARQDR